MGNSKDILKKNLKQLLLICAIITAIPILTNSFILGNNIPSTATNDAWASFFGSYFGGLLTLAGVWWTIYENRKLDEVKRIHDTKPIIAVGVNIGDAIFKRELLKDEDVKIIPTIKWKKNFIRILKSRDWGKNQSIDKILNSIREESYIYLEVENLKNIIRELTVSIIYQGKIIFTCHTKSLNKNEKVYVPIDGVKEDAFKEIDFKINCFTEGNYWFKFKMEGNVYEESLGCEKEKIQIDQVTTIIINKHFAKSVIDNKQIQDK